MRYAKKTGYVLALILFLIFTAGPFVWTFILSVTPEHAMFTGDGGLLPETVIWDNYTELFRADRGAAASLSALAIP